MRRRKAWTRDSISHLWNNLQVQNLPPGDSHFIPSSQLFLQTRKPRLGPSARTWGGAGEGRGRKLDLKALAPGPVSLPTHNDHGDMHWLCSSAVLCLSPSRSLLDPHATSLRGLQGWSDSTLVPPVTRDSERVGLVRGHTAPYRAQSPPAFSLLSLQ